MRRRAGLSRVLRPGLTLIVVALCLWGSRAHLETLDLALIWQDLRGLSALQWAGGLAATGFAFLAVAGQERVVARAIGLGGAGCGRVGAAAAAVSQTVGFGPVVGAIVRRRLRPDLTLAQSFAISAMITLCFLTGLALIASAVLALSPGFGRVTEGAVTFALLTVVVAMLLHRRPALPFGLMVPTARQAAALLAWIALDLAMLGIAFWLLMPGGDAPGLTALMPVFLVALGIGLISGSPAGAGPFEATLMSQLADMDPNAMAVGIVGFRCVSYALPALCGALWAVLAPALARRRGQPMAVGAVDMAALARAEVQLARAGRLHLMPVRAPDQRIAAVWLGQDIGLGPFGRVRFRLGDPVALSAPGGPASDAQLTLGDGQGRGPDTAGAMLLYKVGPRLAALARGAGMIALPIAAEAVIQPEDFSTGGSARASLRRKLNHAARAGISTAEICPRGQRAALEAVHRAWLTKRGRERGFSMGQWNPELVAQQRVFAAHDADGAMVAFVTFHASRGEWVLDLIRYRPGAADGTLHSLIACAIAAARAAAVPRLSLAAVPRAGGMGGTARVTAHLVRRAAGLIQFKSAFRPRWEARYVVASSPAVLMLGLVAVLAAILRPAPRQPATRRAHEEEGRLPATTTAGPATKKINLRQ